MRVVEFCVRAFLAAGMLLVLAIGLVLVSPLLLVGLLLGKLGPRPGLAELSELYKMEDDK